MTQEQLCQGAMEFLSNAHKSKGKIGLAAWDHTMLLFSCSTAMRGDNTCPILLSDLYSRDVPLVDVGLDFIVKVRVLRNWPYKILTGSIGTCYYERWGKNQHKWVNWWAWGLLTPPARALSRWCTSNSFICIFPCWRSFLPKICTRIQLSWGFRNRIPWLV